MGRGSSCRRWAWPWQGVGKVEGRAGRRYGTGKARSRIRACAGEALQETSSKANQWPTHGR